eukprot:5797834-Pleurochrysis_carterae.AAC.4
MAESRTKCFCHLFYQLLSEQRASRSLWASQGLRIQEKDKGLGRTAVAQEGSGGNERWRWGVKRGKGSARGSGELGGREVARNAEAQTERARALC